MEYKLKESRCSLKEVQFSYDTLGELTRLGKMTDGAPCWHCTSTIRFCEENWSHVFLGFIF